MKWFHWLATHVALAIVIVSLGTAWYYAHKPVPQIITHEVQTVVPGETRVVPVVVGGTTVPQVVTAPAPTVRVIVSPSAPVVVTPNQQRQAEGQANLVVKFDITRDCVHPDTPNIPDPTCGKPVDGHIELVQNGAGFVRITTDSNEKITTGPITTQVNHVQPVKQYNFEFRASAGVSTLFSGTPYIGATLDYIRGPLFVGVGVRHFIGGPVTTEGILETGVKFNF